MSNEQSLRQHHQELEKRQRQFDKAYAEYKESIADNLTSNYSYFCYEYDERMQKTLVSSETLLADVWRACKEPNDELAMKRIRRSFENLIDEMATDRVDFEIEMGGLDDE